MPRVTVIDDDQELVELLTDILTADGYEVEALPGVFGMERLAATRPDVIVLDLLLGGESGGSSGWDCLRLIRSNRDLRNVPVVICSADVDQLRRRRRDIRRDGRLAVVAKPFSLDHFEATVADLIAPRLVPAWDDDVDLVLVADSDSRLVDASAAMLAMLGITPENLRRLRVSDIVAESPEWTEEQWDRYQRHGEWKGRVKLRSNGAIIPAVADAEILHGAETTWYVSRLTLVA
jgi:CheY-like chemotaxis protein